MSLFKKSQTELQDKLDLATQESADLETELNGVKETIVSHAEMIATLEAEKVTLTASLETTKADLATLSAENENLKESQADFDKKVAEKTAEKVAELGVDPVNETTAPDESKVDLVAKLKTLKGNEYAKFYADHKADLFTPSK